MGNRADDEGTDIEIYVKPLTDTVHADTRTGAPEQLLALLDGLGFERHIVETAGPVYIWHEVPEHHAEDEMKQIASRAIPPLLMAGYRVNISAAVWDEVAYRDAADELRRQLSPAPAASPPPPAPATKRTSRDR